MRAERVGRETLLAQIVNLVAGSSGFVRLPGNLICSLTGGIDSQDTS
jgi:hypothetical protein